MANEQHFIQNHWKLRPKNTFLPHQEVQLVLQGDAYNIDIGKGIVQHIHGNEAEEYTSTKLNIKREKSTAIDWESIKSRTPI